MEKLISEIKRTEEQLHNIDCVLDTTDIKVKRPENEFLEELYKNLQTFTQEDRNKFIEESSKCNDINPDNKTFHTFKEDQRKALSERLKEKLDFLEKKLKSEEENKVETKAGEA